MKEKKEKKVVLRFGDENRIRVDDEPIDCSRLGYFDTLEEECWELVKSYLDFMGIELLPGEDYEDEERISWDIVKNVQDHILGLLEETGVRFNFDQNSEEAVSAKKSVAPTIKTGALIAVNGKIYEYVREESGYHRVAEIEIDDEGRLTSTHIEQALSGEELQNNEVSFTKEQWYGIVEHIIRQDYELEEEEIINATEDIVNRCFACGIPKLDIGEYIANYMKR